MTNPDVVFTLLDDGRTVKLLRPLSIVIRLRGVATTVIVPHGFESDLASVPRFFWRILPPFGKWSIPAIVHDWLYARMYIRDPITRTMTRRECDKAFLYLMKSFGVGFISRYCIYLAVRLFGWSRFRTK